jgi:hypothetical protein
MTGVVYVIIMSIIRKLNSKIEISVFMPFIIFNSKAATVAECKAKSRLFLKLLYKKFLTLKDFYLSSFIKICLLGNKKCLF